MPSSMQEALKFKTGGDTPTDSFGNAAAGWCTEWMDVRYQDEINVGLQIDQGASAQFDLRMESSSKVRVAGDVDDGDVIHKVDSAGVLSEDILSKTIAADGNLAVRIATKSIEYLRLSGKVDTAGAVIPGTISYDVPVSKAQKTSVFSPGV